MLLSKLGKIIKYIRKCYCHPYLITDQGSISKMQDHISIGKRENSHIK